MLTDFEFAPTVAQLQFSSGTDSTDDSTGGLYRHIETTFCN